MEPQALEYLYANNEPIRCPQTNQLLWPLSDIVFEKSTDTTEKNEERDETFGERKTKKEPKAKNPETSKAEGEAKTQKAPKLRALPKALAKKVDAALKEIEERRYRTSVAMMACSEDEVKPYVLAHCVNNLSQIDNSLKEWATSLGEAAAAVPADKDLVTKRLTDSAETRRQHLFAVEKLEGTSQWRREDDRFLRRPSG